MASYRNPGIGSGSRRVDDHPMPVEPQPRLLVADDDPGMLTLVERMLQHGGFDDVATAPSGPAALRALAGPGADLLICDLHLPGGGVPLLDALPALGPDRPSVLIMTGDRDATIAGRMLERGALAVLHKPFGLDDLLVQVARALPSSTVPRGGRVTADR